MTAPGELIVTCPTCQVEMDTTSPIDGENTISKPTIGAVAICAHCLVPSIFDQGPDYLQLRKPTDEELQELTADSRFRSIMMRMVMTKYQAGL